MWRAAKPGILLLDYVRLVYSPSRASTTGVRVLTAPPKRKNEEAQSAPPVCLGEPARNFGYRWSMAEERSWRN